MSKKAFDKIQYGLLEAMEMVKAAGYRVTPPKCETCGGSGENETNSAECPTCNGTGARKVEAPVCNACEGRGRRLPLASGAGWVDCILCNGTGKRP